MDVCTRHGNLELHQHLLRTAVTCLGIIDNHVISGMGGFIRIFNILSSRLVAQMCVFNDCKLHGISKGSVNYFVVFGGRKIAIIYYSLESLKIETLWHVDDWILCACWLEDENIAIGTAHNTVILWNWRAQEKVKSIICEERCILYSSTFVGSSWDQLVVFAGTVFQEVIIWSPSDNETSGLDCPVLHRLQGHKGVIFSSHYNPATGRIHTTSDDRSVKGWQVRPAHPRKWQLAEINLVNTMYGHTARVWKSVGLGKCTISIGEDSQMCVWNLKGELLNRWSLHQGGSIWSIACSEEKRLLVTGGSDGSISVLSLDHCLKDVNPVLPIPINANLIEQTSQQNYPRRVVILRNGHMIIVLQSGHIIQCSEIQGNISLNSNKGALENVALCLGGDHSYSSDTSMWTVLYFSPKFANYCLLEISACKLRFAVASLDGHILIFEESTSSKISRKIEKIVDFSAAEGKIFSLQWLSPNSILTCEVLGKLCLWSLQALEDGSYSLKKIKTFILPYSKERWVTSALLIDNYYLICGDRVGSIHLYSVQGEINDNEKPNQTLSKVHGRFGVSFLMVHQNYIFSCGRDGTLRQYQYVDLPKTLKQLCVTRMPFDWVSSCCVNENDILVLGFCEKNFVVWTQEQQRLLCEVPCGGGHRSWDYIVEGNCLNFVYIKQKCLFVASCDLKLSSVLQTGFHPKEVNCLQILHKNVKFPVLISGGEDTTIRVALACSRNYLHTLFVLHSHLSSIRAITCYELHENKLLMFSAGGRAQIKAWELTLESECGTSEILPKILCQELSSHMLMNSDNKQHKSWKHSQPTVDPETRYMSLCPILYNGNIYVAAGCSDGYFRVLLYCSVQQCFQLVGSFKFHQRCILNVACVSALNAITMATDGIAAFWDLSVLVERHSPGNFKVDTEISSEDCDLKPLSDFKLHQSGINSFDLFSLEIDHILLATGGDDTALVITAFRMNNKRKGIVHILQWRMESAHVAQITGLAFVDQYLISTSVDQKVFVWKWFCSVNRRLLLVTKVAAYCTTIADIHGLKVWPTGNSFSVCVYGKGIEIIHENSVHEDVK
ncbi:hypothetical protein R5R35_008286 [Gryllus longicercus]|uniref:tRNA (34-2'-O)-methyltransferase regulator WDR6 n=1 Tax=Gryllus longicercus TaxID=2509291 RepID=A0AAN9VTY9_9ORTH